MDRSYLLSFLLQYGGFLSLLSAVLPALTVALVSYHHKPTWEGIKYDERNLEKWSIRAGFVGFLASLLLGFLPGGNVFITYLTSAVVTLFVISSYTDLMYHRVDRWVSWAGIFSVGIVSLLALVLLENNVKWIILVIFLLTLLTFFQRFMGLADSRAIVMSGLVISTLHALALGGLGENPPIQQPFLLSLVAIFVSIYIIILQKQNWDFKKSLRSLFKGLQVPVAPLLLLPAIFVLITYSVVKTSLI